MVEPAGDVCEVSLLRADLFRHVHGFVEAQVGRVRCGAERVEYENVEPSEFPFRFGRNLFDVGAVRIVSDTKSQHVESGAMVKPQRQHGTSQNRKCL